ncbi:MAG: response regulator [Elusimicrobia bacterium]|nr:response regulator [Elusimicrobiota bacterium]
MQHDSAFIKISELARRASVMASTIRYYTDLGILKVAMETEGGHRLYDGGSSLRRIRMVHAQTSQGRTLEQAREEIARREQSLVLLVVDDEPSVPDLIRSIFETYKGRLLPESSQILPKAEIYVAEEGFSAGRRCGELLPDLMILDLMLPGQSGVKICRALKNDPAFNFIKVLAITGYDTPENKAAIMAAGADAYLPKPFSIKEFLTTLGAMGLW